MRIAAVALFVVLVLAGPVAAEEETAAGVLDLVTERVYVFKDGHGLFVKRATGTADARGEVHTFDVPDAAVLGTFWASTGDDRVVAMRAEWVEEAPEAKEVGCQTMAELLEANVGTTVTLALSTEGRPRITGRIVSTPRPAETENPAWRIQPDGSNRLVRVVSRPPPQLVVLEVGTEQVVLPISQVLSVEAKLLGTTREVEPGEKTRRKRLAFALGKEAAGEAVDLTLLYFRPGIRWIPSYRVGGRWDDGASLALQAEILNEAEDLDGADLHLVVGVPNFRFKDVVSPLTLESVLRGAAAASGDRQLASQLMTQNRFSNVDQARGGLADPEATAAIDMAPELAAAGVQDLFVYDTPPTRLPEGARATLPLWRSTVPVAHRYTLDVVVDRDERGRPRSSPSEARTAPLHLQRNDVWHQLELTNATEVPWTTGAALLLHEGRPVAQEILGYTAPRATSMLPITVATDVRANAWEEEVKREANAISWGGYTWWRIHVQGHVELESFRKEATPLRVQVAVDGHAERGGAEGATLRVEPTGRRVNPRTRITWDLELAPGETQKLAYRYAFYTR